MTHNEDDEADFYDSGNVRDMRGHNDGPDTGDGFQDVNLEGLTFEEALLKGRQILMETLIKNVARSHATPQEMNTLRQLLKDNGMVMGDPLADEREGDKRAENRKADLPSFDPPDYAA